MPQRDIAVWVVFLRFYLNFPPPFFLMMLTSRPVLIRNSSLLSLSQLKRRLLAEPRRFPMALIVSGIGTALIVRRNMLVPHLRPLSRARWCWRGRRNPTELAWLPIKRASGGNGPPAAVASGGGTSPLWWHPNFIACLLRIYTLTRWQSAFVS